MVMKIYYGNYMYIIYIPIMVIISLEARALEEINYITRALEEKNLQST